MSIEITTIGELPSGSPLLGTDQFVIERLGGANFKVTSNDISTFIGGGGDPSPLTTKGDIYGYDTADARIAVGTDGQVLTALAANPQGVVWADPQGGGESQTFLGANSRFIQFGTFGEWVNWQLANDSNIEADHVVTSVADITITAAAFYLPDNHDFNGTMVITLRVNGADTALTATFANGGVGVAETVLFTGGLVTINAGDEFLWHLTAGTATAGEVQGAMISFV